MKNTPFVSILVPVYGAEKYLRRCLDSILNQNFEDMEVILVNDASPDRSLQIMEEYAAKDSRFKIIQHDRNYGRVKARKTGNAATVEATRHHAATIPKKTRTAGKRSVATSASM